MTDTDPTSPQTTVQLLHDLGELHTRTLVSPLPKQPAAMGWQATTGAMAAGFARALHALHQADPDKAQEITDWFQGPFEDEGPDPEEHTDWLERVIAGGDLALMEKWVEDGRRLAEASRQATEEREAAARRPRRGDQVEAWLKAQRDDHRDADRGQWTVLDNLLDRYRLHADTGTPLDGHVCEARVVGDCECLEQPTDGAQQDGGQR